MSKGEIVRSNLKIHLITLLILLCIISGIVVLLYYPEIFLYLLAIIGIFIIYAVLYFLIAGKLKEEKRGTHSEREMEDVLVESVKKSADSVESSPAQPDE